MRRVRRNVLHLAQRLFEVGYRFVVPERACVRISTAQFGRICNFQRQKEWSFPVSLTAFLLEVGSVNFMGTHPKWPLTSFYFGEIDWETPHIISDPIVVDAEMLVALLPFDCDAVGDILRIEIAPDEYHKAGVSGGGAQAVNFQKNAVEATIEDRAKDRPDRQFVAYLDNAILWCGFPGFAYSEDAPTMFLDENLRDGLLTI